MCFSQRRHHDDDFDWTPFLNCQSKQRLIEDFEIHAIVEYDDHTEQVASIGRYAVIVQINDAARKIVSTMGGRNASVHDYTHLINANHFPPPQFIPRPSK